MFLAGPKFRNLPASKLASDFRSFVPDILSCSGLLYNLSYTHVVHIYHHNGIGALAALVHAQEEHVQLPFHGRLVKQVCNIVVQRRHMGHFSEVDA